MHLLPCPHCHAAIAVSPTQAGETMACPQCQGAVPVPKLGQLRQLPLAEGTAVDRPSTSEAVGERNRISQVGFALAGLVATVSLLVAGFCGIRWALTEVSSTTEQHIASERADFGDLTAAELIRVYEDMEDQGLDLGAPYNYQQEALQKRKWGTNASIAASIGGFALLAAVGFALSGRRKPTG
jgi:hypothetical protein